MKGLNLDTNKISSEMSKNNIKHDRVGLKVCGNGTFTWGKQFYRGNKAFWVKIRKYVTQPPGSGMHGLQEKQKDFRREKSSGQCGRCLKYLRLVIAVQLWVFHEFHALLDPKPSKVKC